jgi:hypothetical protein
MKADGCTKKDMALCMKLRKNMKFKQYKQKIRGSSGASRALSTTAADNGAGNAASDDTGQSRRSDEDFCLASGQAGILAL